MIGDTLGRSFSDRREDAQKLGSGEANDVVKELQNTGFVSCMEQVEEEEEENAE